MNINYFKFPRYIFLMNNFFSILREKNYWITWHCLLFYFMQRQIVMKNYDEERESTLATKTSGQTGFPI